MTMPEKMQDVFFIGFPTLKPDNPDYYTFRLATNILAGTDLTSRLYNVVREKEGLVYYVYGQHVPRTGAATFAIVGGLAPENLDRAIKLAKDEIHRIQTEPVPDKELKDAKDFAAGELPLALGLAWELADRREAAQEALAAQQGVAYDEPDATLDAEARASSTVALDRAWHDALGVAARRGRAIVLLRVTPLSAKWLDAAFAPRTLGTVTLVPLSGVIHHPEAR